MVTSTHANPSPSVNLLTELLSAPNTDKLTNAQKEDLWDQVHRIAENTLAARFPKLNPHDRSDVAQTVVLKLIDGDTRDIDDPVSYIKMVAHNEAITFFRKAKVRGHLHASDLSATTNWAIDLKAPDPAHVVMIQEQVAEQNKSVLNRLATKQRQWFQELLPFFREEMSGRDLAISLGIKHGTLRSRIKKIRATLKKGCSEHGID